MGRCLRRPLSGRAGPAPRGFWAGKLVPGVSVGLAGQPFLPLPPPRQWVPQLPLFCCEVGPSEGKERGRGSSHFASCGHPRFRPVSLARLGCPRCPGIRLRPETALRPLTLPAPVSGCPFFLGLLQTLSLSLCSFSFCLSLCSSLYLAVSPCICFSVSPSVRLSFPLHCSTSLCLSLQMPLSLSLSFSPLPFPGSIPILCLAAPGVLQQSNGTAWGHLGALPRVLFPVTSTRPSPWRGLLLPSAAVRRGGGARVGRHSAQHLLGSPGAPDPLCRY